MEKNWVKESYSLLMGHLLKGNLRIMKLMGRECTSGQMERCIKDSGRTIRWKVEGY